MASVYVHLSGNDVDETLLKAKGIKIENSPFKREDLVYFVLTFYFRGMKVLIFLFFR